MIVEDQLLLWNQAALKIMDVQRIELPVSKQPQLIRLSESTLLYTTEGRARLLLAGEEMILENGYVFHAGKGAVLKVLDINVPLSYSCITEIPVKGCSFESIRKWGHEVK